MWLRCDLTFERPDDATRLQATIEEATGMPCPCKRGEPCPIFPARVDLVPKDQVGSRRRLPIAPVAHAGLAAAVGTVMAGGLLDYVFNIDKLAAPLLGV